MEYNEILEKRNDELSTMVDNVLKQNDYCLSRKYEKRLYICFQYPVSDKKVYAYIFNTVDVGEKSQMVLMSFNMDFNKFINKEGILLLVNDILQNRDITSFTISLHNYIPDYDTNGSVGWFSFEVLKKDGLLEVFHMKRKDVHYKMTFNQFINTINRCFAKFAL